MSTPSLLGSIDRLNHLLSALRGIARALDPDPVMSEQDRVNLYELTMLLSEHLEACIFELTHVYQHPRAQELSQTAVLPAQEQEDNDDGD